MWVILAGLLLGILIGFHLPVQIPQSVARYLAVSVLAGLDTAFGGLRATLEGDFDTAIFVSGFLANTVLAALLTYAGDLLGLELYLAAVFAFGVRIFTNLAMIRRHLVKRLTKNR